MYQNHVSLIGFLGQKPEARTTTNQKTFTLLSLATNHRYKNRESEEYVVTTEWHRILVWGPLARFAATLQKGSHLLIEGELRSREYTDSKDVKRKVWEIRAPRTNTPVLSRPSLWNGRRLPHPAASPLKANLQSEQERVQDQSSGL